MTPPTDLFVLDALLKAEEPLNRWQVQLELPWYAPATIAQACQRLADRGLIVEEPPPFKRADRGGGWVCVLSDRQSAAEALEADAPRCVVCDRRIELRRGPMKLCGRQRCAKERAKSRVRVMRQRRGSPRPAISRESRGSAPTSNDPRLSDICGCDGDYLTFPLDHQCERPAA